MSEPSNSVISLNKTKTSIGSYLWDSPCLKPLFYNPFLLSIFILMVIWIMDFIYGKKFPTKSFDMSVIQNIVFTYLIIAPGIAINNMMIKYKYKTDKYEKNKQPDEPQGVVEGQPMTTEYIQLST